MPSVLRSPRSLESRRLSGIERLNVLGRRRRPLGVVGRKKKFRRAIVVVRAQQRAALATLTTFSSIFARAPTASSAGGVLTSTRISLTRPKRRKMPAWGSNSPSTSSNKRVEAFAFASAEQNGRCLRSFMSPSMVLGRRRGSATALSAPPHPKPLIQSSTKCTGRFPA